MSAEALYRDEALSAWLEAALVSEPGVRSASANPLSATVLVLFEVEATSPEKLLAAIRALLARAPAGQERLLGQAKTRLPVLPWHQLPAAEVLGFWRTKAGVGLAFPLLRRRQRLYGPNALAPLKGRGTLDLLQEQVSSLPTLCLLGAASFSILSGDWAEGAIILSVIFFNGGIGYATEASAEKVIASLVRPSEAGVSVLRGGRRLLVPPLSLVPGDLLLLSPGLRVPADARIVEVENLSVDESALTGESLPVLKTTAPLLQPNPALGERKNLLFRGTVITGGTGVAVVVRTGAQTEVGRIQGLMGRFSQPQTPLQAQLGHLGNRVVYLALGMSGAILLVGALRGMRFTQLIKSALSLAVAAIPESLPTIATTTLARGIHTLEGEGLLVRRLDALEALGGVDVLCLDKTGTLTQNEMAVTEIFTSEGAFSPREIDLPARPSVAELLRVCSLCNEAKLPKRTGGSSPALQGSPTEQALLEAAELAGIDTTRLRREYRLVHITHRTENRSYMTTTHRMREKLHFKAMKGRPEEVLALCAFVQDRGRVRTLREGDRIRVQRENARMAESGLRVLGVAYKKSRSSRDENGMVWLGLVGLSDPLRPGIAEWIETFHGAGVRTVMITGDQTPTALAIGRQLRISGEAPLEVVDSSRFSRRRERDLVFLCRTAHVFSRVSPSDKLRIVRALQSSGQVVAMVGDGINDGPALKIADVGVALGGHGERVTSEVADVVLLNDNLKRLVLGLEEGRRVQDDIKKAVAYILTQNFAEMLFTLLSVSLGLGAPLSSVQLLWMNLVTDLFPELALAQEPSEPGALKRRPVHSEDRLFDRADMLRMLGESGLLTAASLAAYAYAQRLHGPGPQARTVAFQTIISASLLYTLSARSQHISLLSRRRLAPNPWVPLSVGAGFFAESLAVLLPPLRRVLGTTRMGGLDLGISCLGAAAPLLLIELNKFLEEERRKHAA